MEQSTRISLALLFCTFGGDDGIRTHDPLLAGQVLSQLSYTPTSFSLSRSLYAPQKLNNNSNSLLVYYLVIGNDDSP